MISVKKHAVRIILISIISIAFWGCGGGTPSIKNGEPVTGLSGTLDTVKTYKISIPENTLALLIEHSGSADVQLELFDENAGSLLVCPGSPECWLENPAAGNYKLKLTATNDYENVSIAAAWGGPYGAALKNDVAVTGLEGPAQSSRLTSLFLPDTNQVLLLQTENMGNTDLLLMNDSLDHIHYCSVGCEVGGLEPGLYFLSVWNSENYSDASIKASWGLPSTATLENGVPKRGLSGEAGERIHETFFLPDQAESLLLIASNLTENMEIADQQGNVIQYCPAGAPCFVQDLEQGLYTVWMTLQTANSDFSITAAWGGETMTSLQNRSQKPWIDLTANNYFVDTFFAPADAEFVAVAPLVESNADSVFQQIFNSQGELVAECWIERACVLPQLQPGFYFVQSHVTGVNAPEKLYVALNYGGRNYNSLSRHENKFNVTLPASGTVIETFSANVVDQKGVFLGGSSYMVYAEDGTKLDCIEYSPCRFMIDESDAFIAYVRQDLIDTNSISTSFFTWTEQGGSLQNQNQAQIFIEGNSNEHIETFSVPAHVEVFMVASSDQADINPVGVEIYRDDEPWGVAFCYDFEPCVVPNEGAHDYVLRAYSGSSAPESTVNAKWALAFGGANYSTIENGEMNAYHNLKDGDFVIESFVLPTNTEELRIASSMSARVDVFDINGGRLCQGQDMCINIPYVGNLYFARVTKFGEIPQAINISMAYGANGVASMRSGDRREKVYVDQDSVILESFYITEGTQAGLLAAYSASGEIAIRITSSHGIQACVGLSGCSFAELEPGLYFAEIRPNPQQAVTENIPVSYSLLLASEHNTTVNGAASFYDLNLVLGETHLSSFYLPEGIDKFAISHNDYEGFALYDSHGQSLPLNWRVYDNMEPGFYFIQYTKLQEDESSDGYAIALAGEESLTLPRGIPKAVDVIADGRVDIEVIFVPDGTETLFLMTSNSVFTEAAGYACGTYSPCIVPYPQPGYQFIFTTMLADPVEPIEEFSMTVQYVGPGGSASMANGELVNAPEPEEGQYLIQSFYVENDNVPIGFSATENVTFSMYDTQGNSLEFWSQRPNMWADYSRPAGGYFVVMEKAPGIYDQWPEFWYDGVSAKALWGNTPTIENAESITVGNANLVMESFYVAEGAEPNYPDVYLGMVSSSTVTPIVEVTSQWNGGSYCDNYEQACWFPTVLPGVHYITAQAPTYWGAGLSRFSITWGGPKVVTLENGHVYQTGGFDNGFSRIHSFYLTEATTVTLNATGNSWIEVASGLRLGEVVDGCISSCTVDLEPGQYFAHARFAWSSTGETYQVSW